MNQHIFISKLPIFNGVNPEVINELIQKNEMYIKKYNKNQIIHYEGAECTTLDIVTSGKVAATLFSENGAFLHLFSFHIYDIIGANLLFGKSNNYALDIYAEKNVEMLHINKAAMSKLLKSEPFMMTFIQSLSQNAQGLNQKITTFKRNTLRQNLIQYFDSLSIKQRTDMIHLPVSKKALADQFGVQRPSLFRELKRMEDASLILSKNKSITLLYKNKQSE